MGCIIEPIISDLEEVNFGVSCFWVRGIKYKNSAVGFWSALLCEVRHRFPRAHKIIIDSCPAFPLDSSLLHPSEVDISYLDSCSLSDIRQHYADILSEMEIFGEPSPIYLGIWDKYENKIINTRVADSVVNSEVFPMLLVWLLYWAGLPENCWNEVFLKGLCRTFVFETKRQLPFLTFTFELSKELMSEGLTKWLLTIYVGKHENKRR